MSIKRRKFIKDICLGGVATYSMPFLVSGCSSVSRLNILVLGGTNFLGPVIVDSLIRQNHNVTLFNRGITNPNLFPKLNKIRGNREKGIIGYNNLKVNVEQWDVVIDVWPENPHFVQQAIEVIKDRARHYIFVSSIAVYKNYKEVGLDEHSVLRSGNKYEPGNYNLNKTLCEKIVEDNFPESFTIVRPGAIVGDRDSGPFGLYVLNRIANRKEIFAPDSNDPVQFIDAQDIGKFLTRCAEEQVFGHFNLVGPTPMMGYKQMYIRAKEILKSDVKIIWMDPQFLVRKIKLEPFIEIPFWIPADMDPEPGFYQISNEKAIKNGLKFTNYSDTVKVSYESFRDKRYIPEEGSELVFGIGKEREDSIIRSWKEQ